jgi:hypothetical protein
VRMTVSLLPLTSFTFLSLCELACELVGVFHCCITYLRMSCFATSTRRTLGCLQSFLIVLASNGWVNMLRTWYQMLHHLLLLLLRTQDWSRTTTRPFDTCLNATHRPQNTCELRNLRPFLNDSKRTCFQTERLAGCLRSLQQR